MLGSNLGPLQLMHWQSDTLNTRLDLIRFNYYLILTNTLTPIWSFYWCIQVLPKLHVHYHLLGLFYRGRISDEIQTKVLRVFFLAIHSHLCSFALRFLFLPTHATSYNFYSSVTVSQKRRREENLIETINSFPMV